MFSLQIDQIHIYIYLNDRRDKRKRKKICTDFTMKLDIDNKVKKKSKVTSID